MVISLFSWYFQGLNYLWRSGFAYYLIHPLEYVRAQNIGIELILDKKRFYTFSPIEQIVYNQTRPCEKKHLHWNWHEIDFILKSYFNLNLILSHKRYCTDLIDQFSRLHYMTRTPNSTVNSWPEYATLSDRDDLFVPNHV